MGKWSQYQISLPVIQHAAWYETTAFRFTAIALFLTSLLVLFKVRTRSLKRQKAALNKIVKDRTRELEEKNQQLEMASLKDPLTGAYNRYFFNTVFRQQLGQLKRAFQSAPDKDNKHTGLMMLDADYFKQVNDVHGHNAGDKILILLAEIMGQNCRESDKVIRWGGEEFIIIYYDTSMEDLENLAEKIRSAINSRDFKIAEGETIKQTCSIGLCTLPFVNDDVDAFSIEQTIQIADNALYMAKNSGRNCCVSLTCNLQEVSEMQSEMMLGDSKRAVSMGIFARAGPVCRASHFS